MLLSLARIGDSDLAEAEAAKSAGQAPLDTVQRDTLLAATRASIQMRQRNFAASIQSMQKAKYFPTVSVGGVLRTNDPYIR